MSEIDPEMGKKLRLLKLVVIIRVVYNHWPGLDSNICSCFY